MKNRRTTDPCNNQISLEIQIMALRLLTDIHDNANQAAAILFTRKNQMLFVFDFCYDIHALKIFAFAQKFQSIKI